MNDQAWKRAKALALKKFPGRPDQDNPLSGMRRSSFIAGYMARDAEPHIVTREVYVRAAEQTGISTYEAGEFLRAIGFKIEGDPT